ncbi:MAG: hypothetical protein ABEK01_01145 [Candidatus Nanohaloarchaea archaeon]
MEEILIVVKDTVYERHYDGESYRVPSEHREKVIGGHRSHRSSVEKIKEATGEGSRVKRLSELGRGDPVDSELVVTVGGDGTVLNTAQHVRDTPVATVRSDERSTGELCVFDTEGFIEFISAESRFRTESWTRLKGEIDGREILALNEVFVGPGENPGVAEYRMEVDGRTEEQVSSGVVASTGTGSTAWYSNIPGTDSFPRDTREIRFAVREMMEGETGGGVVGPDGHLRVVSEMDSNGVVSFDGSRRERRFDFSRGSALDITVSETPLRVVYPAEPEN